MMRFEDETEAAVAAVAAAAILCTRVQAALGAAGRLSKADRSPVTVADFGAQAVVSHVLSRALPAVPLMAEEDADALRSGGHAGLRAQVAAEVEAATGLDEVATLAAIDRGRYGGAPTGRYWVLDPIDGTMGFLRGEQYAVALALIEDGEPVVAVLGCPNLPWRLDVPEGPRGVLMVAVRGLGTTVRPLSGGEITPARVAQVARPADATFCESVEGGHSDQAAAARIATRLGITRPPLRMDSQCKYAAIARGDAAVYLRLPVRVDYCEKVWDHAAGWLTVIEAGGRVTDAHGRPLDFRQGRTLARNAGVIASNGALHDQVLAAVAPELAQLPSQ